MSLQISGVVVCVWDSPMKILFLAPQPFFQERGTPIAVRLAVQVLAMRGEDTVDLLTYHEGSTVSIPQVNLHRIPALPFIRGVGPGISFKKLICDFVFFFSALSLVIKNRKQQYDLIHAVEESVFVAYVLRLFFRIPYIYDMDSSLALQVTEKWFLLRPLYPLLAFFEKIAVRNSTAVVPVCDALAAIANQHGAPDTEILRDVSLLDGDSTTTDTRINLRAEIGVASSELLVLYIGNLEPYQGIDLLIDSFAEVAQRHTSSRLVIIGGAEKHIERYALKIKNLSLSQRIHLLGPKPVACLSQYLLQADILASPRVRGNNTPMKIYSYLHSGKPIVATELPTHTQVMDRNVAQLAKPDCGSFAQALYELLGNKELQQNLGSKAQKLAEEKYTFSVFSRALNHLYDRVKNRITAPA